MKGGDIALSFRLYAEKECFFLKTLPKKDGEAIFLAESQGLKEIEQTQIIKVPEVLSLGSFEDQSFLLMRFIESRNADQTDFENLGRGLAEMHQISSENFGFKTDNFIGLLPQKNEPRNNWSDFYAENRLFPQLRLAVKKKLLSPHEIPDNKLLLDGLRSLIDTSKPSLLHGDLWAGNYLIALNGTPYLIDPAVYYGHREADLAMSRLFGGFDEAFYLAYYEIWPQEPGENERIKIYQLYHLLVHLNLFGLGYKASVKRTLDRYFGKKLR